MASGMKTRYWISILMVVSSNAMGDVSLFDGAYRRQDTDTTGFTRHYSSRKLQRGLFGTGWCHPLENRLLRKGSILLLHDCRSPLPIEYRRTSGPEFIAEHNPWDKIREENGRWTRSVSGQRFETYDSGGKITGLRDGGLFWIIKKVSSSRTDLISGQRLVSLQLDLDNRRIKWLQTTQGERVFYSYQDGNLIGANSSRRRIFGYETTRTGDILKATDGRGATEFIAYDEVTDRVQEVRNSDGCRIRVEYPSRTMASERPRLVKRCPTTLAGREEK